ncbi:lysophospholipid acyltransferase family protein [Nitrogeniibacter mangrovi]|uniref:lysophospholipid acyltransferase family protein n=1 Tax=Nitrogeniibacter mangrovi TaxID=2016596 RepID=UPI001E4441A9|nr:lysophospholipid acyltransferase family protein [Nitrogeniibacter mangrovi]
MLTSATVFPFLGIATRGRIRQRWSRTLLRILGIELHISGAALIERGLLVANHVSWVDIFVINALTPAAFVSKADVREWPVIGWLSAVNETVFLRRGSRGHARVINDEIAECMANGRHVALFPEGTTTDGSHVLHFHAALLQPAILTGHPIQPVALRYRTPEGGFTRAAAYDGDVSLGQCIASIVGSRRIVVHLDVLPAIDTGTAHRREIARAAHAAITDRVAPEQTPAEALAA